jgi:indolepyruvate ferredoxin oxidoreductase
MAAISSLDPYELSDRYDRERGRVFLTGTQAIVRIALDQVRRDRAAGLNTAGFISGYRGSPLGGIDLELWRIHERLKRDRIEFLPAVNEDLAATAVLGSQQVETQADREVDGVFALWYGKGPGVDRSGDALKHGNAYGSSWRRSGGRRRRPWLRLVLDAAPVRRRLHELVHADAPPRKRQRISRIR